MIGMTAGRELAGCVGEAMARLRNWPGSIAWNVAMADHTTLRAGGRALALVTVSSHAELSRIVAILHAWDIPWQILGKGSNLLISSDLYPGVLIRLQGELTMIRRKQESVENGSDPVIIAAGGGCSLARLVAWCAGQSLTGLEFLVGIPGTVGGAVCMNAGAWGKEIGPCIHSLGLMDGTGRRLQVSAAGLLPRYRQMVLREYDLSTMIVTEANFILRRARQKEILVRCQDYLASRRKKQPAGVASAGSFFRNPVGDSAGRLIEAAGMKGACCGKAMMSTKHANFLVNLGGATVSDILRLMNMVQEGVRSRFGVHLEPEVHIL